MKKKDTACVNGLSPSAVRGEPSEECHQPLIVHSVSPGAVYKKECMDKARKETKGSRSQGQEGVWVARRDGPHLWAAQQLAQQAHAHHREAEEHLTCKPQGGGEPEEDEGAGDGLVRGEDDARGDGVTYVEIMPNTKITNFDGG
jgi:hypothetical protein